MMFHECNCQKFSSKLSDISLFPSGIQSSFFVSTLIPALEVMVFTGEVMG